MNIFIENNQSHLKFDLKSVEKVVLAFKELEQVRFDEVSINFVTSQEISELHKEYFNDPTPTDCISFPIDGEEEEYRILGEIFICPSTAISYANEHGLNPHEEATLYLIHGLLHLIGLDDIDPEDRKEMRLREKLHMENLKKLNLQVKNI